MNLRLWLNSIPLKRGFEDFEVTSLETRLAEAHHFVGISRLRVDLGSRPGPQCARQI
jgi:hypothetical protein